MAHTLTLAKDSAPLAKHMQKAYHTGAYTYTLSRASNTVMMQVTGNGETRSAELRWAFGSGEVGQSYLWQEANGDFREARFNYFVSLNGFGPTPGRLHGAPISMEMAIGRGVEPFEARTCFACHTTAMHAASPLDVNSLVPGVTCEACHGPGAQHVSMLQAGNLTDVNATIVNPKHMSPSRAVDFCGACHSTPSDVRVMGAVGLQTVRFPAYRLEKSRCWGAAGDARVTCFACHNPHEPLQREAASYDKACLRCHRSNTKAAGALQAGFACPVGTAKCTTCHMPSYELPEMHARFTDHQIRVVRPGAPFPD